MKIALSNLKSVQKGMSEKKKATQVIWGLLLNSKRGAGIFAHHKVVDFFGGQNAALQINRIIF